MRKLHGKPHSFSWDKAFKKAFPDKEFAESTWRRQDSLWFNAIDDTMRKILRKKMNYCPWGELCNEIRANPSNRPPSPSSSSSGSIEDLCKPVPARSTFNSSSSEDLSDPVLSGAMSAVQACREYGCPWCHKSFPQSISRELREAVNALAKTWKVLPPTPNWKFHRDWDDDNAFCDMHEQQAKVEREKVLFPVRDRLLKEAGEKYVTEKGEKVTRHLTDHLRARGQQILEEMDRIYDDAVRRGQQKALGSDSPGPSSQIKLEQLLVQFQGTKSSGQNSRGHREVIEIHDSDDAPMDYIDLSD